MKHRIIIKMKKEKYYDWYNIKPSYAGLHEQSLNI